MSEQLMVALYLKMVMISQVSSMVMVLSIVGRENILSFVMNLFVYVLKVIFVWGILYLVFLQSAAKWKYAFNTNIFISGFIFYHFVTQSYFFLLKQHEAYLFYKFTQQIIFFYLDNCCIINIISIRVLSLILSREFRPLTKNLRYSNT